MRYVVIYHNDDKNIITRIGPFSALSEARKVKDKVHSSRRCIISEERKTLPDNASEPAPEFYRFILRKENYLHKMIEILYASMGKKTPFKAIWTKL